MTEDKMGYAYTKPRAPIGAMYKGPGPVYKLPPLLGEKDHAFESIHIKAPAYSFGQRHKVIEYERSPGPAAYPQDGKITNHGVEMGRSFSLKQRLETSATTPGPGPAQYLPNTYWTHPRAPEYQFGTIAKELSKMPGPAPNAYSLPRPDIDSRRTTAPQFTLGARTEGLSVPKNPGPADYTVGSSEITKRSAPKFSIGATLPPPSIKQMPGPADYSLDLRPVKPAAPKFSMGIYHSPYKLEMVGKHNDDLYDC